MERIAFTNLLLLYELCEKKPSWTVGAFLSSRLGSDAQGRRQKKKENEIRGLIFMSDIAGQASGMVGEKEDFFLQRHVIFFSYQMKRNSGFADKIASCLREVFF